MQTFDQSLMALYQSQAIAYDEALRQASNPDDFALRVSGVASTSDARWDSFEKPAAPAAPAPAAAPPRPAAAPAAARPPTAPAAKAPAVAPAKPGEPTISLDEELLIERF
jgi:twitching motility protein PilT